MRKIAFYGDKTLAVPQGEVVVTGYVPIEKVRLACRDVMGIGDVREKYELVKQNAPSSLWPPPIGHWDGDYFVIEDGRHHKIAYEMNGYSHILVAWLERG
jgi:hypothetical protein